MKTVAFIVGGLLGKLLDPVSLVLCFILLVIKREKWMIGVSAIAAAIASETVITLMLFTRTWGEGLVLGFIASLIHSVLAYWVVGKFRKKPVSTSDSHS